MHLSRIEYNLLALLARNEGKLLTHRAILREVWGPSYQVESHYLHVYISRLRQKIEPDPQHPRIPDHRAGRRLPAGGRSAGRLRTEYATDMGAGDRFTGEQTPPTDAFSRALSGIILPIALTAALVIAMYPFREDLNTGTIALVLLLPPLLATIGGLRTAVAMAVVGALTFNFFFTEPYNTFRIEASESIAAFFIYLLVAFIVALFASRVRDHDRAAAERLARAELLQQETVQLLTAEHPRQTVGRLARAAARRAVARRRARDGRRQGRGHRRKTARAGRTAADRGVRAGRRARLRARANAALEIALRPDA